MGYAKKIEKKIRNDYIALVQELFGEVKRDLLQKTCTYTTKYDAGGLHS